MPKCFIRLYFYWQNIGDYSNMFPRTFNCNQLYDHTSYMWRNICIILYSLKRQTLLRWHRTYEKMKTLAILIAAVALLLGTDAGLLRPAPGTVAELTRPAPDVGLELTKPAPQPDIKPLPGTGGEIINTLPGTPATRNVLPHLGK